MYPWEIKACTLSEIPDEYPQQKICELDFMHLTLAFLNIGKYPF